MVTFENLFPGDQTLAANARVHQTLRTHATRADHAAAKTNPVRARAEFEEIDHETERRVDLGDRASVGVPERMRGPPRRPKKACVLGALGRGVMMRVGTAPACRSRESLGQVVSRIVDSPVEGAS